MPPVRDPASQRPAGRRRGAAPGEQGAGVDQPDDPLAPGGQGVDRRLHEIERSFYEHDPAFAKGVSETTLYRHAGRSAKWAFLGLMAGFVLLIFSFASNRFIGFFAFLLMLVCALSLERNFRKMGKAGWAELTQTVRERGFPNVLGETRTKLGKRFKRDDQS